jgi:hypothetical protein
LAKTGEYIHYGNFVGPHIKQWLTKNLNPIDTLTLYGFSQGALRTMGIAPYLADVANKMKIMLVDPPGSKKMSLLELAFRFVGIEGTHAIGYRMNADDVDPVNAQMRRSGAKLTQFMIQKVFSTSENKRIIKNAKSMTWDSLQKNLTPLSFCDNLVQINVCALEYSAISNIVYMKDAVRAFRHPNAAVSTYLVKGATHSLDRGKMIIISQLIKRLIAS